MARPGERHDPRADRRSQGTVEPDATRRTFTPPTAETIVLPLQAGIGNRAVARLLAREPEVAAKPEGTAPAQGQGGKSTESDPDEAPITKTGVAGAQEWGDRAYRYFDQKLYAKSLDAFEHAYALDPLPAFLYNEGSCLEGLGRNAEAADMFARYLAESQGVNDGDKVREKIRKLRGEATDGPRKADDPAPAAPAGKPGGADPDEAPITTTGIAGAQDWGDRAYRYFDQKQYAKSLEAFEKAYSLYPVAGFLYNEGSCLEALGRYAEAADMLTRYLAVQEGDTQVEKTREKIKTLRAKAGGAATEKKTDDPGGPSGTAGQPAEGEPAPVTATGPAGAQEWSDRGWKLFRDGKLDKAAEAFAEAYKLDPLADFLLDEAGCLEQLGRKTEAADLFDRYLAAKPDAKDAAKIRDHVRELRGAAGEGSKQAGEPGAGAPAATPGPGQAPETPITATGAEGATAWFDRGIADYKAQRFDKARGEFAEAYKLDPLPEILYNEGAAAELGGHVPEALELYARYLAEAPGAADVEKVKKHIAKLRGEAPPQDGEAGGETGPDAPITATGDAGAQAWFDRAQEAFLNGDYVKAVAAFKHAYELKPMPAFVFDEGTALEKSGRAEAAANAFEHYLVLDPGAKDSAETLERIKKLRGEAAKDPIADPWPDEASAPAVTAGGTEGAKEWHARGTVAYELGDFQRAYDCFVHAYDLAPLPLLVYNQAAALDRLGNTEAAIQAYERYLAVAPTASDADRVHKRIATLRARTGDGGLKQP
jgi:tetratricopeptide (TPR) repeat protein